jgi:hypothetical protein
MPKTALVIVHLSSLDSFTADAGPDAGGELGYNIADAILNHDGPVIVVDQNWSLGHRESRPRSEVLKKIKDRKDVIWIQFDEDVEEWDPFLRKLRARLKLLQVKEVIVGGVWYDPKLKGGCATEVYLYLRKFFKAQVDPELVGCE